MAEDNDKEFAQFENLVNEYLDSVRELEYTVFHFMKKSNKTTALDARNAARETVRLTKFFKDQSIKFFN